MISQLLKALGLLHWIWLINGNTQSLGSAQLSRGIIFQTKLFFSLFFHPFLYIFQGVPSKLHHQRECIRECGCVCVGDMCVCVGASARVFCSVSASACMLRHDFRREARLSRANPPWQRGEAGAERSSPTSKARRLITGARASARLPDPHALISSFTCGCSAEGERAHLKTPQLGRSRANFHLESAPLIGIFPTSFPKSLSFALRLSLPVLSLLCSIHPSSNPSINPSIHQGMESAQMNWAAHQLGSE